MCPVSVIDFSNRSAYFFAAREKFGTVLLTKIKKKSEKEEIKINGSLIHFRFNAAFRSKLMMIGIGKYLINM